MQVRTAQCIRDAEGKIADFVLNMLEHVGKKIDVVVDWDSFVNHASYTGLHPNQQSALFTNLLNNHISLVLCGYDG
jgi:hypothetical protein